MLFHSSFILLNLFHFTFLFYFISIFCDWSRFPVPAWVPFMVKRVRIFWMFVNFPRFLNCIQLILVILQSFFTSIEFRSSFSFSIHPIFILFFHLYIKKWIIYIWAQFSVPAWVLSMMKRIWIFWMFLDFFNFHNCIRLELIMPQSFFSFMPFIFSYMFIFSYIAFSLFYLYTK